MVGTHVQKICLDNGNRTRYQSETWYNADTHFKQLMQIKLLWIDLVIWNNAKLLLSVVSSNVLISIEWLMLKIQNVFELRLTLIEIYEIYMTEKWFQRYILQCVCLVKSLPFPFNFRKIYFDISCQFFFDHPRILIKRLFFFQLSSLVW